MEPSLRGEIELIEKTKLDHEEAHIPVHVVECLDFGFVVFAPVVVKMVLPYACIYAFAHERFYIIPDIRQENIQTPENPF